MECQPVRTQSRCYTLKRNQLCSREETLETIVPDACPDIARILDTTGVCRLERRELTEGGVLLAGTIQTVTLYVPEGEDGLGRLESEIPFQHRIECPAQEPDTRLMAAVWVSGAETRVVNPRKVLLRVSLAERIRLYGAESENVSTSMDADPQYAIQQRWNHVQTTRIVGTSEKAFTLNDAFSLSPGRWEGDVLLRALPQVQCTEARMAGQRLILKGSLGATLLLRSDDGQLHTQFCELPFSQMLDAPETEGECRFQLEVQVLRMTWGALSADQRTLPVTAEILAQAVYRKCETMQVLTDLYSTRYPMKADFAPVALCRFSSQSERLNIRALIQTAESVQSVCACHTELGTAAVQREGERLRITVPGQTTILYQEESGALNSVVQTFQAETVLDCSGGDTCVIDTRPGEMEALRSAAGMELRGTVEVRMDLSHESSLNAVQSAQLLTDEPWAPGEQPSVVLIRPSGGECVWDIAKRCRSTCQDILTANGLQDEDALNGQMLLVPRCR